MKFTPLRFALVAIALVVFASLAGCASGGAGQRPPDVAIAQTATAIVQATTNLQNEVNRLTAAGLLPVDIGQKFTDADKVLLAKASQLSAALDTYHAATSLTDRSVKASQVQTLITELSGPLAQMLGLKLPEGAAQSVSKLLGNVMAVIGTIQGEIARGLQGAVLRPPLPAVA